MTMQGSRAADVMFARMHEMAAGVDKACSIGFPAWEGRSLAQQTAWLRQTYPQRQIARMFLRALRVLDTTPHESAEWDLITDEMDPLWLALDRRSRPW